MAAILLIVLHYQVVIRKEIPKRKL